MIIWLLSSKLSWKVFFLAQKASISSRWRLQRGLHILAQLEESIYCKPESMLTPAKKVVLFIVLRLRVVSWVILCYCLICLANDLLFLIWCFLHGVKHMGIVTTVFLKTLLFMGHGMFLKRLGLPDTWPEWKKMGLYLIFSSNWSKGSSSRMTTSFGLSFQPFIFRPVLLTSKSQPPKSERVIQSYHCFY